MPRLPGVNHLAAVRVLEKVGFRIIRQGNDAQNDKRVARGDADKDTNEGSPRSFSPQWGEGDRRPDDDCSAGRWPAVSPACSRLPSEYAGKCSLSLSRTQVADLRYGRLEVCATVRPEGWERPGLRFAQRDSNSVAGVTTPHPDPLPVEGRGKFALVGTKWPCHSKHTENEMRPIARTAGLSQEFRKLL